MDVLNNTFESFVGIDIAKEKKVDVFFLAADTAFTFSYDPVGIQSLVERLQQLRG